MRKTILLTAILFIIFLFEPLAEVVKVVEADPFWIFKTVDPVPGTIPPTVTIISPKNNQEYYSDRIVISFNVSKPHLGTCETAITNVKYTLDSDTTEAFSIWRGGSASNSWAVPEFDTTFTSPFLTEGNQHLTVYVEGVVYAGNMTIFFTYCGSTAYFTMGNQTLHLSPIPSQISTQNPTQVPELSPNPSQTSILTQNQTSTELPEPSHTPAPAPASSPLASSDAVLASDFSSNRTFQTVVLSMVGLFTIIVAAIVYKRKKTKTTGYGSISFGQN